MFYLGDKRGGGKVIFQSHEHGITGMWFDGHGLYQGLYNDIKSTYRLVECDVLSIIRSFDDSAEYIDVLYNNLRKCYTGLRGIPMSVGSTVRGQLLHRPLYRLHVDEENKQFVQLIYPLQKGIHSGSFDEVVREIRVG